jgi:hypothetical protein
MTYNIYELFQEAALARREADATIGEDDLDEDDDPSSFFVNAPRRPTCCGRAVCHQLEDGDFHLCFGANCEFVTHDRERQLICSKTGLVVGVEHSRDQDPSWTGRSVGSANPDDTAGTPLGGWIRRRDMFSASVSAYRSAASISDAEIVLPSMKKGWDDSRGKSANGPKPVIKRGALCVDEAPDAVQAKRPRSTRRETWTREALDKLRIEAGHVVAALMIVEVDTAPQPQKLDPRLQNIEFVRTVALRKYVKACKEGTQELNLDVLHNVCVYANEFVRTQRALAADAATSANRRNQRRGPGFSGQVRNLVANLIVSLWRASCATPHMRDGKRSNDSFRPFAAGILYSFKRGLYLNDGTCVVPALEALAQHLPALRSPQSTVQAKQLQSSSHRGICSFHKSISSMELLDEEEAIDVRRLFSEAATQAAFLRALVFQNNS